MFREEITEKRGTRARAFPLINPARPPQSIVPLNSNAAEHDFKVDHSTIVGDR